MRLLLVEDDVELGRRLSERLRAADFAVELATSRSVAEDWPDVDQLGALSSTLGCPMATGWTWCGTGAGRGWKPRS